MSKRKRAARGGRWQMGLATLVAAALAACGGGGGGGGGGAPQQPTRPPVVGPAPQLDPSDVRGIMESAARSIPAEMAIAVTDREGNILGVGLTFQLDAPDRCAGSVYPFDPATTPPDCRVVNLAIQLARTGSFFSADQS